MVPTINITETYKIRRKKEIERKAAMEADIDELDLNMSHFIGIS